MFDGLAHEEPTLEKDSSSEYAYQGHNHLNHALTLMCNSLYHS